ncbi:RNA polymerase sigma factor [Microbacterium ulmi]|uniref:RNA polymerase sigma factor n=1 Tax=Microbacterium ulmi TaxID=179095 RepID=A0A7Y2LXR8_9MICO|nr:sigma-70 family RNA polymerase sigma factor [Microbacterium ulmi]NII70701.1 RNA polymerase sigma-70 factor (ECF subfamily) [Microbacterium ulmi]NNH02720.1 sigma-70 family RNA polymerase sigma factor [Microbacterium ulmi]
MTGDHHGNALEDADDRIVAGRAADGDVAAFAVLVRRYTPMMRAYTRRMLPGSSDVDDIVQDALVTAWQRLPELAEPAKVKSWLMRIVSRKAVDRIRSTRPQVDIDEIQHPLPIEATPPRIVETRAEVAALGAALRELPDAQRQCWVLRELGGLSYDEIAGELDVPASTVRGLLARARRDIIVRMEEWR